MNRFLIAAALVSLAVPLAVSAVAAPAPTTVVRHADLDLANARDAQVMLGRIKKAAARVCLESPGAGGSDFASIEAFEACHRTSIAKAVADLGAPRVSEAMNATSSKQILARLP